MEWNALEAGGRASRKTVSFAIVIQFLFERGVLEVYLGRVSRRREITSALRSCNFANTFIVRTEQRLLSALRARFFFLPSSHPSYVSYVRLRTLRAFYVALK